MKTVTILIIIVLVRITTATAPALGQRSEVYPKQASFEHNQAVKNFSRDFVSTLSQTSSPQMLNNGYSINNMAAINIWGDANMANITQQGYGMLGSISIYGDENQARLNQTGINLLSILTISGDANRFDMTQEGSRLSNGFLLIGSGFDLDVTQTHQGVGLSQGGTGSIPFSIQHSGQLPPIMIEKN